MNAQVVNGNSLRILTFKFKIVIFISWQNKNIFLMNK